MSIAKTMRNLLGFGDSNIFNLPDCNGISASQVANPLRPGAHPKSRRVAFPQIAFFLYRFTFEHCSLCLLTNSSATTWDWDVSSSGSCQQIHLCHACVLVYMLEIMAMAFMVLCLIRRNSSGPLEYNAVSSLASNCACSFEVLSLMSRPISSRSPTLGLCVLDTWRDTGWSSGGTSLFTCISCCKNSGTLIRPSSFDVNFQIFSERRPWMIIQASPFEVTQEPTRLFGRPRGGHLPPGQLQQLAELNQTPFVYNILIYLNNCWHLWIFFPFCFNLSCSLTPWAYLRLWSLEVGLFDMSCCVGHFPSVFHGILSVDIQGSPSCEWWNNVAKLGLAWGCRFRDSEVLKWPEHIYIFGKTWQKTSLNKRSQTLGWELWHYAS